MFPECILKYVFLSKFEIKNYITDKNNDAF